MDTVLTALWNHMTVPVTTTLDLADVPPVLPGHGILILLAPARSLWLYALADRRRPEPAVMARLGVRSTAAPSEKAPPRPTRCPSATRMPALAECRT